jgi:Ca2+-binding RTX toxin-like protein
VADLLANDTDENGDVLSITAVAATSAAGAALTLNGDGTITYDPTTGTGTTALARDELLNDSFTYTVSDGLGGTSEATVTLTVVGTNNPPEFVPSADYDAANVLAESRLGSLFSNDLQSVVQAVTIDEGQSTALTLPAVGIAYDDPDGDTMTDYSLLDVQRVDASGALVGAVASSDLSWSFTPSSGALSVSSAGGNSQAPGYYLFRFANTDSYGDQSPDSVYAFVTVRNVLNGGGNNDVFTIGASDPGRKTSIYDDFVKGAGGADTLYGDAGFDTLQGQNGSDTIHGGDGDDYILGDDGDDTIFGDAGDDEIHGGADIDTIKGGTGADRIFGGNGADVVIGGLGDDTLTGGVGADHFVFFAGDGSDTITDFSRGDGDMLYLDLGLVGAGTTAADVVSSNAAVVAGGIDLTFSDGTLIHLDNLNGVDLASLASHIAIGDWT